MKYKIIKCFLAVSCAVCVLYGSVRSVYHSAVVLASETTAETTEETEIHFKMSDESTQPETAMSETTLSETESTEADTEYIEETVQEQGPTLEEYLSLLTCGGCGRNCLLINPRCHNGSRKASMATEEYYTIYG